MSSILREYIKSFVQEAVDKESSFMIAVYPNEETIQNIINFRKSLDIPQDAKILNDVEIHNTVRYWEYHEDKLPQIIEMLSKYRFSKPAIATSIGLQKLGDSVSIMLESPVLHSIYNKLDKAIQSLGLPPSDYPEYKPHVAFFYSDEIPDGPIDTDIDFDLVFEAIKLVDQDDKVLWEIHC